MTQNEKSIENDRIKRKVKRLRGIVDAKKLSKEVGKSKSLINKVLLGNRTDHYNILKKASVMIDEHLNNI